MPRIERRNSAPGLHHSPAAPWSAWQCVWLACAALALTLPVAGCGGCTQSTPPGNTAKTPEELEQERRDLAERLRKEKEEAEKPDYELLQLRTRPSSLATIDNATKVGHWGSATMDARSNREDFNGMMKVEGVDPQGEPLVLDRTVYTVSTERPVQLAKKQKKNLEITYFPPTNTPSFRLRTSLQFQGGRSAGTATIDPLILMPEHQYHLVVLSATPDAYSFLKAIPTVRAPSTQFTEAGQAPHYRIHSPTVRNYVPLASSALKWTTIAYLVWDDFQPGKLQTSQQEALIDWLHWGGQLVISGPKSLDTLKGSFLEPYLPADSGGAWELNQAELDYLNRAFQRGGPALSAKRPWSGVKLALRPEGAFIPDSGELVAERRVGAGRIAVTAFSLTQRDLRTWPGIDEMANSWLLRRDPRVFTAAVGVEGATVAWEGTPLPFVPEKASKLRFFTRDWLTDAARSKYTASRSVTENLGQAATTPFGQFNPNPYGPDIAPPIGPGVAGWNDFSDAAVFARESLRTAAGIKVPKREFVFWTLGTYVLVLAPLNWLIFRMVRRVEWAWLAVPVLAIGFSIGVIRLAQLDIGFARSTTELAVVEIQGPHAKGHVTRYTAMYSSLASNYDLEFDDPGAVALPLAAEREQLTGQSIRPVTYWRDSTVKFTNFGVDSNATGMVHSEHFLDMGGALRWEPLSDGSGKVVNETEYELKGAGVVRRDIDPQKPLSVAWIGDLKAGTAATVQFESVSEDEKEKLFQGERAEAPQTAPQDLPGQLNVRRLVELAETTLAPGETRLIAWTEQELPGIAIDPPAPQNRQLSLIVAHLDYGVFEPPLPDKQAWLQVVDPKNARFFRPGEDEDEE